MRGVAFLAAAITILLIGIGICVVPLAIRTTNSLELHAYILEWRVLNEISSLSFSKGFLYDCAALTSILNAIAAFVILSAISNGVLAIAHVLHFLSILKSRIPLIVVGVITLACTTISFALMVRVSTGVFCSLEMNSFMHLSTGFGCMIIASIIAMAAMVTIIKSSLHSYTFPLALLGFILSVGACFLTVFAGDTTNQQGLAVTIDITLFLVNQYQVVQTTKIADLGCSAAVSAVSAIAAFAILTCIAAGAMIIAEGFVMMKSISSRIIPSAATAATSIFSILTFCIQIYAFTSKFCGSDESFMTNGKLAGGFVCTILVMIISSATFVLTNKTKSMSMEYRPLDEGMGAASSAI